MKIREITARLNELSVSGKYRIGHLQDIRKEIKGKSTKGGIFRNDAHGDRDWAFHWGGRSELQFNIGYEDGGLRLRYGLAFSLEPSRSYPDLLSCLKPKIFKLNCIIREQVEFFEHYHMWAHVNGLGPEDAHHVIEISPKLAVEKNFIFIGKLTDSDKIDFREILSTFDELLDVYIQVESESDRATEVVTDEFLFDPSLKQLPRSKKFSLTEKEVSVDVRHSLLQDKLVEGLRRQYGDDHVGIENTFSESGNRVDVALNDSGTITFFEIKVASSARLCIRQAMGQLLDYAFWGGKKQADKVVAVGEHKLDKDGQNYISLLRDAFRLPIEYMQVQV
jgi:hypothetical protein